MASSFPSKGMAHADRTTCTCTQTHILQYNPKSPLGWLSSLAPAHGCCKCALKRGGEEGRLVQGVVLASSHQCRPCTLMSSAGLPNSISVRVWRGREVREETFQGRGKVGRGHSQPRADKEQEAGLALMGCPIPRAAHSSPGLLCSAPPPEMAQFHIYPLGLLLLHYSE